MPAPRIDYYTYIQSPERRSRADAAKRRAGYRCQVCNRPNNQVVLNAHHRTYDRLGHEHDDDITVLCRDCHELYESNKRLPKPPAPLAPSSCRPTSSQSLRTPTANTCASTTRPDPIFGT